MVTSVHEAHGEKTRETIRGEEGNHSEAYMAGIDLPQQQPLATIADPAAGPSHSLRQRHCWQRPLRWLYQLDKKFRRKL